MQSTNNFYTISIDDKIYMVGEHSLNSYPSSLLHDVINGQFDKAITYHQPSKTLFIDRDPTSFSYVVDVLRGYDFNPELIKDACLLNKINQDFKYYKIDPSIVKLNLSKEISDLTNIDMSIPETPLLDKFQHLLFGSKTEPEEQLTELQLSTESEMKGGSFDTSILKSNDPNKIKPFLESLENKLQSKNSHDLINQLSNDENMKNLIKNSMNQTMNEDSDTDSLDFNVTDDTDTKKSSELKTDINYKTINSDTSTSKLSEKSRFATRFINI